MLEYILDTPELRVFTSKMGSHVGGIANRVAHVIDIYFTCRFIFVRSFCIRGKY